MPNTLFYGDNLEVLQAHVADSSVDLIYLDPPFNSNRDYNVLFKEQSGSESAAQIKAFGDTWKWANAALDWENFPTLCPNPRVQDLMQGFVNMLGRNDVTAYLVMMAPRLYHLHRVLKPTGSLYLHCDPTASHYLKLLLDAIFGPRAFRNEIIWVRHEGHSDAKRFGTTHDVIFYYRKTLDAQFNKIYTNYSPEQLKRYRADENGRLYRAENLTGAGFSANRSSEWRGVSPGANRHWMWSVEEMERLAEEGRILFREDGKPRKDGYKAYLDEMSGKAVGDVWTDVGRIPNTSSERLGYPTQKPLALLERIISASSNPGDVVLDPFCGCGTAIVAAQALGRKWLGIDITPIATTLIQDRLKDKFQLRSQQVVKAGDADFARAFAVEGLPTDVAGAKMLYDKDPTHKDFEMWAVGLIPMLPQDKKGADGGIDGIKDYQVGDKKPVRAVAQVKGGKVGAPAVQQLRGAMEKFGATLGLFVTLEAPTKNMADEALSAGFYTLPLTRKQIPRVQIRTVGELLDGRAFDVPSNAAPTQAVTVAGGSIVQGGLEL